MSAAAYIAAVRNLAATGTEGDPLFLRLSGIDCMTVIAAADNDPTLRDAILHPRCSGLVDTYVLSMVAR